jgi:Ceramidase
MSLGEHVFLYCERGTNETLFGEPINAISNIAFLLAALLGLHLLQQRPREEQSADQYLFVGLVFLIGLGSLAFHLLATQGTELADVIPIGVFMLVYLGFALNRFLGVPPGFTVLLVIGFMGIMAATMQVKCWDGGIGVPGPEIQGVKACLNGSLFYLPGLAALIVIGLLMEERRLTAAPYVLVAAAIFAVSITLRSLDLALCDEIKWQGRATGTHFAWHLLNAIVLFLLIRASLEVRPSLASAEDGRMLETADEEVAPETEEGAKEDDAPEEKPKALFPA